MSLGGADFGRMVLGLHPCFRVKCVRSLDVWEGRGHRMRSSVCTMR